MIDQHGQIDQEIICQCFYIYKIKYLDRRYHPYPQQPYETISSNTAYIGSHISGGDFGVRFPDMNDMNQCMLYILYSNIF